MDIALQERTKDQEARWFTIAGAFFLVVQIIIVAVLVFDPAARSYLLWSCNNFCFFVSIACFFKNMQLVKGISYVGLVTQLLWSADYTLSYVGVDLSTMSDYAALAGFTFANVVTIVIHVLIPLLVLALSFRIRPELRSLAYAVPYILLLFLVTAIFSLPADDVNCVYASCGLSDIFGWGIPYAWWLWPVFAMIPAFLGYTIHKVLYFGWHNVWRGRAHREI